MSTPVTSPQIVVEPGGRVRLVYDEAVDLQSLGAVAIRRASHVEPTDDGQWTADLAPVGGPMLGPYPVRSEALAAEREWLARWLANGVLSASEQL
jgi:hypothetical protein